MYIEATEAAKPGCSWRTLGIEHLQLSDRINEALHRHGVAAIDDALRFADSCPESFQYAAELKESVSQIRACLVSDGLDWSDYWLRRSFQFEQLAADWRMFDLLAEKLAPYAVDRRSLGNAGAMLQASGIRSFPVLVAGLRTGLGSVRGIGRTKIAELFEGMFALVHALQKGRVPTLNPLLLDQAQVAGSGQEEPSETCQEGPEFTLSEDARQLPISVLQLGAKTQWLQNAGHETVGDLADTDLNRLRQLSAVGRRTVTAIREKLTFLEAASRSGALDWHIFAEELGVPLIPAMPVLSGGDMLNRLPVIMEELVPHLRDDSYRSILLHRLTKGPGKQRTLEELAREAEPRVTRERIRQKEKKLIRQLAGALVWDVNEQLGIQFHPTFTRYWRDAAREFEGVDELGFEEFVERLAAAWRVPRDAVVGQLPFIFAIVTGDPQLPANFRPAAKLDPVLFRLDPTTSSIPIRRLRLGKRVEKLEARGVTDLRALVRNAADGTAGDEMLRYLNDLAACIDRAGRLDWEKYAELAYLRPLPSLPLTGVTDFLTGFNGDICGLLAAMSSSDRRRRVFELRTSQPQHRRPTLDAVAKLLVTHGPTVKREETELLRDLHDVLVDGDFSSVPLWLRDEWLAYIRQAASVFLRSGRDFAVFQTALSDRWAVPQRDLEAAVPGLWAIFTGYPEGIKRGRRAVPLVDETLEPARVRLRGFRRLH